jgi:hypothetical protein
LRLELSPHWEVPLAAGPARTVKPQLQLTLDLSALVLRRAVHGDYRPGLSAYLGTSTTSLGGLRLRF